MLVLSECEGRNEFTIVSSLHIHPCRGFLRKGQLISPDFPDVFSSSPFTIPTSFNGDRVVQRFLQQLKILENTMRLYITARKTWEKIFLIFLREKSKGVILGLSSICVKYNCLFFYVKHLRRICYLLLSCREKLNLICNIYKKTFLYE